MTLKCILLVVSKLVLSIVAIDNVVDSMMGQAVSYSIHGYVLDTNSKPIVAANVILVNTPIVTVSDNKGFFSIDVTDTNYNKIEISSLGYKPRYLTVPYNCNDYPIAIYLKPLVNKIEQVKVMQSRSEYLKRKYSISIELVEEEFLKEGQAGSLMQTLSKIPGVNSMDVGTGISKPMIRGLGYYRVIVAQNGIKQEGQQWSSHHGINVDQNSVNHVELIKGPASLRYGSGAIGGVINILPGHIPINQGVSGEASFFTRSNNGAVSGFGNIMFRKNDVYVRAAISYASFADYKVPATDSFQLPAPSNLEEASHEKPLGKRVFNTAGNEGSTSIGFGLIKSWGTSSLDFEYYTSKTGFFDWERSKIDTVRLKHQANHRDILVPYQHVTNYSIRHLTRIFIHGNKLELALGFQQNNSDEYAYLENRTGNRAEEKSYFNELGGLDLALKLNSFHGNFSYTINSWNKQKLTLGFNSQYQKHTFSGYNHILPEYSLSAAGAFAIYNYEISNKWESFSGVRLDINYFEMNGSLNPDPEDGDLVFNPDFSRNYPGLSVLFGLNYYPDENTILKFNIGKSYRVPSAYELGAYGLHRHEGRFEKGDISCLPEEAWQFDLSVEKNLKKVGLTFSPFVNYFTNYLYLNPTSELRQEGQVYEYVQSQTLMTGGEFYFFWKFLTLFEYNLGAEYVYVTNLDLNTAIPQTPPLSVKSEIKYQHHGKNWLKDYQAGLEVVKVFAQKYTVVNELQTPGYIQFNLVGRAVVKLGEAEAKVFLGIRNLFNSKYYNHISFYRRLNIPEPGRSFNLGLTIPF